MSKRKRTRKRIDKPVAGWQLCPKCNGDGNLLRYNSPPYTSSGTSVICDLCNGKKIISVITGLPPQ